MIGNRRREGCTEHTEKEENGEGDDGSNLTLQFNWGSAGTPQFPFSQSASHSSPSSLTGTSFGDIFEGWLTFVFVCCIIHSILIMGHQMYRACLGLKLISDHKSLTLRSKTCFFWFQSFYAASRKNYKKTLLYT